MIRALALLAFMASPAIAQTVCLPRADLVAQLAERFDEVSAVSGVSGGQLLEIWAAPSGSWTLTLTSANGIACVIAVGESFEATPAAPRGDAL